MGIDVAACDDESSKNFGKILIDSGSAVHICGKDFFPMCGLEKSSKLYMRDVSGNQIPHHGKRTVDMLLGGMQNASVTFEVWDVSKTLLSVGKLLNGGFTVNFTPTAAGSRRTASSWTSSARATSSS